MPARRLPHILTAVALLSTLPLAKSGADVYAPTSWPTVHADGRNSDSVSFTPAAPRRVAWTALTGSSILTALTIGPGGKLYVTTGGAKPGGNLHALDRNGKLLWTAGEVDAGAYLSAAMVDRLGMVYVGDLDQMFCFRPDGTRRWARPLPAPVVSGAFTRDGDIVAITIDGHVLVMRRSDGRYVRPWLKLEGVAPGGVTVPRGLWKGMVAPSLVGTAAAVFEGRGVLVAGNPAVHPATGRVFVVTTDGRVYGIDIGPERVEIAFSTPIGEASGTSVALSPDGGDLYVGDGSGELYAIDTSNGNVLWSLAVGGGVASPAVAGDGTVYMSSDGDLVAVSASGTLRWRRSFDDLAASALPRFHSRRGTLAPQGRVNSVVAVTPERLYLVAVGVYRLTDRKARSLLIPKISALLVLRRSDGALAAPPVVLPDTSEAVVTLDRDGTLYVVHGSVGSSIVYYGLNPFLPPKLKVAKPTGGVSAVRP